MTIVYKDTEIAAMFANVGSLDKEFIAVMVEMWSTIFNSHETEIMPTETGMIQFYNSMGEWMASFRMEYKDLAILYMGRWHDAMNLNQDAHYEFIEWSLNRNGTWDIQISIPAVEEKYDDVKSGLTILASLTAQQSVGHVQGITWNPTLK